MADKGIIVLAGFILSVLLESVIHLCYARPASRPRQSNRDSEESRQRFTAGIFITVDFFCWFDFVSSVGLSAR